jgi:hypothetical protein
MDGLRKKEIRIVEIKNSQLSTAIKENGITHAWKLIQKNNTKISVNNKCKLVNISVAINIEDVEPSYIRQYPIFQALLEKVKARIQLLVR